MKAGGPGFDTWTGSINASSLFVYRMMNEMGEGWKELGDKRGRY